MTNPTWRRSAVPSLLFAVLLLLSACGRDTEVITTSAPTTSAGVDYVGEPEPPGSLGATSSTSTSTSTSSTSTSTTAAPVVTEPAPVATLPPVVATTAAPATTAPPAPPPTMPPAPAPNLAGEGYGGCVIPQYICDRESGNDPGAVNPTGCGGEGCYGRYQFAASTWNSTVTAMGRGDLVGNYLVDGATQDQVAAYLWAGGAGCSHWAAC